MPKTYIAKTTQIELDNLAKGSCEYCKQLQKFLTSTLHNEHIFPLSSGGKTVLENLAKACETCNNCKQTTISAIDPLTNVTVPLFHPRKQIWSNHFKWSDDLLLIIGLTPIGRATVSRLKMNREAHINIRSITIGLGHPPD